MAEAQEPPVEAAAVVGNDVESQTPPAEVEKVVAAKEVDKDGVDGGGDGDGSDKASQVMMPPEAIKRFGHAGVPDRNPCRLGTCLRHLAGVNPLFPLFQELLHFILRASWLQSR